MAKFVLPGIHSIMAQAKHLDYPQIIGVGDCGMISPEVDGTFLWNCRDLYRPTRVLLTDVHAW